MGKISFISIGNEATKERFQVREHLLVRILDIQGDSPGNTLHPCRCKKRGRQHQQRKSKKLSGTGKICLHCGRHPQRNCFFRLELGVNAIAHSYYDNHTIGKKDKVSFVVTHIDEERNVAVGIITRIIRQNL